MEPTEVRVLLRDHVKRLKQVYWFWQHGHNLSHNLDETEGTQTKQMSAWF